MPAPLSLNGWKKPPSWEMLPVLLLFPYLSRKMINEDISD